MIYRIEIGLREGVPDARGRGVVHRAAGALKMNIEECRTRDVYKVVAEIDAETAATVQNTFADPALQYLKLINHEQQSSISERLFDFNQKHVLENLRRRLVEI